MSSLSFALLLLCLALSSAAVLDCPTAPGTARAACFCKTVTVYKYYADTLNGCTGAMWCYGPGQSTYTSCPAGLLFSDTLQYCDWAANVKCASTGGSSPPPPALPSPAPTSPPAAPSPSPPATSSPAPASGPSCAAGYTTAGGSCGATAGGKCCPGSQCCSQWGSCGVTAAHCSVSSGCQSLYGACTGVTPTPPSPSPSPAVLRASPSPAVASPAPVTSSPAPVTSSPAPVTSSPAPVTSSPAPPTLRGTLPTGPLMVGYYQTWSAGWASTGAALDLAKIPAYVNVVIVSFAKPDCTYTKGSLTLSGTGLDFSSDGLVVRGGIAALKAAQPNTRVLLAVGGATYYNFAGLNTKCVKDIVDDFGFDGVDLDYEPQSNCVVGASGVSCPTDAESVAVTAALRAALPAGQYLLSTASWHVGMFGEGEFVAAPPRSAYTGVNLAMAKSAAGQSLDLINIMAYDAGNTASTGFDWAQSYRAHRALWKTQAIAIGVEIPPEAWGGNVIALPEVTARANYAREAAGSAPYGIMLWSLHKQGCPNAQQITSSVCVVYGLASCSTPLPFNQASCSAPPPSSSTSPAPASPPPSSSVRSPSPPATTSSPAPASGPSCSDTGYTTAGGSCGAAAGGKCCPGSQCCSQWGSCGVTAAHCSVSSGCQALYGACTA